MADTTPFEPSLGPAAQGVSSSPRSKFPRPKPILLPVAPSPAHMGSTSAMSLELLPSPVSLLNTPAVTPRKRPAHYTYGDRFIPSRTGRNLQAEFALSCETPAFKRLRTECNSMDEDVKMANLKYQSVLQHELVGSMGPDDSPTSSANAHSPWSKVESPSRAPSLLNFRSTPQTPTRPRLTAHQSPYHPIYSGSPISQRSHAMLCPPFDPRLQRNRLIDRHPYKILDAPNILDDFYLHLLDWSVRDVIAVALGLEVYLWNARTEHISLLGGLVETGVPVTAVGWSGDGDTLVVGKSQGKLAVWNYATGQKTQEEDLSSAHQDRVGVVTFHQPHGYLTGCRDHIIREFDLRVGPRAVRQYRAHEQEVCGLAVAARGRSGGGDPHLPLFASGGNENCVMVWDQRQQRQPLWCWNDHKAAIRALAWSPHERHILASGGGTADQTIRIRNAKTGTTGQVIETGSQVCNVIWSHTSSELVSAHGYSQHHIALWSYPDFKKIATLTGHRTRVLNSALSPDGENLVTAAADETLRFWKVFKPPSRPSANVALIHQLRALR